MTVMTARPRRLRSIEDPATSFTLRQKLALVREITVSYVRAWRWLRQRTIQEAVARARMQGDPPERELPPSEAWQLAWRLGRVVERGLDHLPGDTRCLTRSLVLVQLLARRGIPSTLVIGVKSDPFLAHAWVEHDGRALLDPSEYAGGRLTGI
jgi:Transglutaminase-like superfamily